MVISVNSYQKIPPIEGFFIKSKDDLIFDVKGLSHPDDRIIAFVRYVPSDFIKDNQTISRKGYCKIYDLKERYQFLKENFPKYLFHDEQGLGLLQAIPLTKVEKIYDPRKKLERLIQKIDNLTNLERNVLKLANVLVKHSKISSTAMGVTGSILVDLENDNSDIDLVIYGYENSLLVYNAMNNIFESEESISRYTEEELRNLWIDRGQENQISFKDFIIMENSKQLQGKINGIDFYIRLVLFPEEFNEDYIKTSITKLDVIEITAKIIDDKRSMVTPCIYQIDDVEILSNNNLTNIPERIFSVRGRYCELAKKGDKVRIKGRLECIKINNERNFYQITLGTTKEEFFKKD